MPSDAEPSEAAVIDIVILVMTGGMERTEQQIFALLQAAQVEHVDTVPTGAELAPINAVAC